MTKECARPQSWGLVPWWAKEINVGLLFADLGREGQRLLCVRKASSNCTERAERRHVRLERAGWTPCSPDGFRMSSKGGPRN
jgi:hypothetical protein